MFAFHKNKSSTVKIDTRQVNGISVIDISGRITLGEGDVLLRDTIGNLLAKGQKKLLRAGARQRSSASAVAV